MSYTPGPWKIGSRHPGRVIADGAFVACCTSHPDDDDQPNEVEAANARLIAAAPELVVALEDLEPLLDSCWDLVDPPDKERITQARAVLAKVKGV